MKTAFTELFDLIKSLNKHEKAYFSRFCSVYNKDEQQYQILFDLINAQKEYNEVELKKRLKNNNLKSYLPQAKNYLYHRILESMRSYHAQRSKLQELRMLLVDIDFLMQKDLHNAAQKLIKKALKLANAAKLWFIIAQLWRTQFMLWFKNNFETTTLEELKAFAILVQEAIGKEANALELQTIQAELRYWILQKGDLSKWNLSEQLAHCQQKLLTTKALDTEAQFYKTFGLAHCFRVNYDYQKSIDEYKKGFNLLGQYPDLYKQLFEVYLTSLTHWIGVAINRLDEKEGTIGLRYLEQVLKKQRKNLSPQEYIKYYAYYQFLTVKAAFDYGYYYSNPNILYVENSQKALKKIWDRVDLQVRLVILLNYIYISLAKSKFAELMKWSNTILDAKQKHLRSDIFHEAQVWLSIAHFEEGDYELVKYQIRNLKRQKIDGHPINKIILDTLNNAIKGIDTQIHWKKMITALEKWAEERKVHPPIIIYTWALAKSQKKDFAIVHKTTKEAKKAFLAQDLINNQSS